VSADAVAVNPSWAGALPQLGPEEIARLRRTGPVAEQLRDWGRRFGAVLPKVLEGLWPLAGSDETVLRLVLHDPDRGDRVLDLDHFPTRIGRGEGCALQLPHPAVSTEHAEIQLTRGQVFLMDLRSTNSTRRNGQALLPLSPVALEPGDRIDIGPFGLSVRGLLRGAEQGFEVQASAPRYRPEEALFAAAQPADRWARFQWAGQTALVRVSPGWVRACWQRVSNLPAGGPAPLDAMEEGAAQFVVAQIARTVGETLKVPVDFTGWLVPEEAKRAVHDEEVWLQSDVFLKAGGAELTTSVLVPAPEPRAAPWFDAWQDLAWPASVCLGLVRIKASEWNHVDPGDALLPDVFWPQGFAHRPRPADLGPAFLRVRRTWHAARLLASEAGVKLRLETLWLQTPGGDWLMAEEDSLPGNPSSTDAPQALSVRDLELQVAIELDRFPVTIAEIQRWKTGEVVSLQGGPEAPVRLVVETGMQRRVLGEGRVVIVNGRLAIEILRVLTTFEDAVPKP
jgi:flagellar motor switch/type III secretory pathway protein FliN